MAKEKKSFLAALNRKPKKENLNFQKQEQPKQENHKQKNNMEPQKQKTNSFSNQTNNLANQLNDSKEEGQLSIDVYQTEDDIVIQSLVSGVKPEDLDINIQNDMVTIRGERHPNEQIDPEDYYYQECFWGRFSRAIILPVDIDSENAKAEIEDGVLTIKLPKTEKIKTRKIKVVSK